MILFKNIMIDESSGKGSTKQLEFLAAGLQIMFWVRQCNVYCNLLDLVKKNIPISVAYREFQITLKKNILYYLEWRSAQELPFPG